MHRRRRGASSRSRRSWWRAAERTPITPPASAAGTRPSLHKTSPVMQHGTEGNCYAFCGPQPRPRKFSSRISGSEWRLMSSLQSSRRYGVCSVLHSPPTCTERERVAQWHNVSVTSYLLPALEPVKTGVSSRVVFPSLTSHEQFQTYAAWCTHWHTSSIGEPSRCRARIQIQTDLSNLLLREFPYMRRSKRIWLSYSLVASTPPVIVPYVVLRRIIARNFGKPPCDASQPFVAGAWAKIPPFLSNLPSKTSLAIVLSPWSSRWPPRVRSYSSRLRPELLTLRLRP